MRNVLVTGAFGVVGRAVAKGFMDHGDRVVRLDKAAHAPDINTGGIDIGGVDLTDPNQVRLATARICDELGPINILINVTGAFIWKPVAESDPQDWKMMYDLNVLTCLTMTKAVLPHLISSSGSSIVNIGAAGALSAGAGMAAYAASKSAVHRMTESLAAELADYDCTVNAILPTIIDTPANRAAMPDGRGECPFQPFRDFLRPTEGVIFPPAPRPLETF